MASVTEIELCAEIREWAEGRGFVVYPEVLGWDLVAVPRGPNLASFGGHSVAPGEQVGIHAKLRANCDVIAQAVHGGGSRPTWPVVAVPHAGQSFRYVAHRLGIGVLATSAPPVNGIRYVGSPRLVECPQRAIGKPLPLPTIASRAIQAGSPSPRVLSVWREKALRFLIWARENDGRIRIADLDRFGISRSWAQSWFVDTGERTDRRWFYRLVTEPARLPDHGYQDVYAELVAAVSAASAAAG